MSNTRKPTSAKQPKQAKPKGPVDHLDFEVDGEKFRAELSMAMAPTPRFIRLATRIDSLAQRDELTSSELADSIVTVSDYLEHFGIDAEDMPAPKIFAVLRGLYDAMKTDQELTPGNSSSSAAGRRSTPKKSATRSSSKASAGATPEPQS